MQIPPGGGNNPREAQELEARFSALSAEISASLDTILATLERSPGDEHAIAVARELVAAQHSVTQQLLMLSQQGAVRGLAAPNMLRDSRHPRSPSRSALQLHQSETSPTKAPARSRRTAPGIRHRISLTSTRPIRRARRQHSPTCCATI